MSFGRRDVKLVLKAFQPAAPVKVVLIFRKINICLVIRKTIDYTGFTEIRLIFEVVFNINLS